MPQYAFLGHLRVNVRVTLSTNTHSFTCSFNTTRICVGLSSAVFKICGQRSVNVSYNLQSEMHCMQSVICSLKSAVCCLQSANVRHRVESGFALNVLFNIFKANTLQKCSVAMWNSYSCNWFNNPQQGRFVTIASLKYILFLINSVWTVSFWLVCLFVVFNPLANLFPGGGEFDLKIFPRAWGFGMIWSGPLSNPLCQCAPGLGGEGWGFQLTSA